jgi:glycosyltransferase involved in cell wall biosynthesis
MQMTVFDRESKAIDLLQSRHMKILYANKYFFPKGGSEIVMFDEMKVMREHELDVIEISTRDPRNLPSKFESYFASEKSYRSGSPKEKLGSALSLIHSREAVRNIAALIRDEKPDILHCHNIYHQLTPSIINAASAMGLPVVLTLHDFKIVCPTYLQLRNGKACTECAGGKLGSLLHHRCAGGSLAQSALLWAEARYHSAIRSYHRVSKFIAPSLFMRNSVRDRLGDDKVVHIPNGIDASRIEVTGEDENYALFLGRLSPEKGIETLLRAHEADNGAWRLVIAGTGPMLSELQGKFPLAEFAGHLSGSLLKSAIQKASIIVAPSEGNENSPLSILEAMAHAKPVVASRMGGIPELVRHGVTGLLFDARNAAELSSQVRMLLRDANLRTRFGRAARTTIEAEYSLRRHGAALLSLYQSLASASPIKVG